MAFLLGTVTLLLAFAVGYAIRRGSICAVYATRALVIDGKTSRFRAFFVASAGSGAIIVPLHWALPDLVTLSAGYPVTLTVLLGGAAFGIGAWINGACVLGTLAHLTGGEFRYVASVLGMVSGATGMAIFGVSDGQGTALRISSLEEPSFLSISFVLILTLSLVMALYRRIPRWWRAFRDPAPMRMGPYKIHACCRYSGWASLCARRELDLYGYFVSKGGTAC